MRNWRCSAEACTTARGPEPCAVPARDAPPSWSRAGRPPPRTCLTASTRRGIACRAAARGRRWRAGGAVRPFPDGATRHYEPAHPEKAIPWLVKARPPIAAIADPLAKVKLTELDDTIAQCAGLFVEAQARQFAVAPGETLNMTASVLNRSTAKVTLEGAGVEGIWNQDGQAKPANLEYNQRAEVSFNLVVPAGQAYTQPYWLVQPATADVYRIDDQMLIGLPDTPAAALVRVRLTVDGAGGPTSPCAHESQPSLSADMIPTAVST